MIATITIQGLATGDGTNYTLFKAKGFESPLLDSSRYRNPGRHGATIVRNYWRERVLRLGYKIRGATKSEYATLRRDLLSAFDLPRAGNITLPFTTIDGRSFELHNVNLYAPHDGEFLPGYVSTGELLFELIAGDPLVYSQTLNTQSVTPPVAGGITLPTTLPFSISLSGGSVTITNNGRAATSPTLRIYGPATNGHLRNSTTGLELAIENTIPAGSYVEISSNPYDSVLLNNLTNWLTYFDGDMWDVEPGANIINFSSDDNHPDSYAEISWRDAETNV